MQIKQVCDCSQILYFISTEYNTHINRTNHSSVLLILFKQIQFSQFHHHTILPTQWSFINNTARLSLKDVFLLANKRVS